MLNVNINLDVPSLPDNDLWFANAAAWKNYWANINLTATFDGYNNIPYAEVAFDNTTQVIQLNYGDVTYYVASQAQFNSLLASYQALNTSFKNLLQALKNAGVIENT